MLAYFEYEHGGNPLKASELKMQIEGKLKNYITHFVRYAGFSHLTLERKEILAGAFVYLKDDNDTIPDNVPNIGYLDDLMVFVEVARYFIKTGAPISGVCSSGEVLADLRFVETHMGLIFGNSSFSIDTIINLGKRHVSKLTELAKEIEIKYANFGGLAR